nr:hypothetical protein [Tanacetum cinerariifolium]
TEKPLLKDPNGEDVDVHAYRSMIGSLMYLTSSRPDIMFALLCTSAMDSESTAGLWGNDVTRLQALVDKKKVVVTEAAIKEVLRLDDAEGVDFLPNEDIFAELARMALDACTTLTRRVEHLEYDKVDQALEITKLKRRVKKLEKGNRVKVLKLRRLKKVGTLQRVDTSKDTVMEDASDQGRMIDDLDKDNVIALIDDKEEEKKEEEAKEDEPAEVQEVVDIVTTAKLITEVVTAAIRVAAASTRRKKGVVIRDPKEESSTVRPADTKSKDKAKRRKLNEEVEVLKKHLEIMPDEDDDVYTKAIPLARKNCDREDLESLWSLVKERFSTSKPNNFSDDFLLTTLGAMFERPDGQAQVRKNQRIVHGQAKVKSWKLLESCGVHIITFTTTQLILLVERRYPLLRFTLDQMLNAVRLKMEEQIKMSLELLSEDLSAAKQKLMILDSAAERRLMLLSNNVPPVDNEVASLMNVKKRKKSKDVEPSRRSKSKESKSSSYKGSKSQSKSSGKSAQAEEPVFETVDTEMPQDQGDDLGNTNDQPNTWISKMATARKPPTTFDELISTQIDFSAYVLHNLKIENLTQEHLFRPAFNLLKGTCKSRVELKFHFEECYKAITDKLDWTNPERYEYPFDLSKPLPLIKDQGRQVVPADYFFNNDLEYLKVTHVKVVKKYDYGYLDKIIVRREDQLLHKFIEGDFPRLNLHDIKDMLLLLV